MSSAYNYFQLLRHKVAIYKQRYEDNPRTAAWHMAVWNLKQTLRLPNIFKRRARLDENILHIGVAADGGLGDICVQILYLKEIRKLFNGPVVIDLYCRSPKAFQNLSFINNCNAWCDKLPLDKYDVFLFSRRYYDVLKIDNDKAHTASEKFYQFCQDCLKIKSMYYKLDDIDNYTDFIYTRYCLLFGKNRLEQGDPHEIIPVTRNTPKYISFSETEINCLSEFNLIPGKYITLNRGAGTPQPGRHPKLWPLKNYDELAQLLHKHYPQYKIVQIGTFDEENVMKNTDLNLAGKTNIEQVKVLLKYAALHIDNEGGLVHIRSFLNETSLVLFGPTRIDVFGYENNINIHSEFCKSGCEWVIPNWYDGCHLGCSVPLCMAKITTQMVFKSASQYLDGLADYTMVKRTSTEQPDFQNKTIAVIGKCENVKHFVAAGASVTVYDNDYFHPCDCGYAAEYGDAYNIPTNNDSVDIVYLDNPDKIHHHDLFHRECARILKAGGVLLIHKPGVPDYDCYSKTLNTVNK